MKQEIARLCFLCLPFASLELCEPSENWEVGGQVSVKPCNTESMSNFFGRLSFAAVDEEFWRVLLDMLVENKKTVLRSNAESKTF